MLGTFRKTEYRLQSVATGKIFDDSGWMLEAAGEKQPGLVRAIYSEKQLNLLENGHGLYKFAAWLPVMRLLVGSSPPVT